MEPGRQFNPPATSLRVQAIYDTESIAVLVRWHDMRADNTGKNDPSLAVPIEEEKAAASGAPAKGGVFGDQEVAQPAAAADPFAEAPAAATAPPSEFSDAIAIQIPTAGSDRRAQALLHLRRRPELRRSLVLRSCAPRSNSVHRPGKRGPCTERHRGSHRCREIRPGRMDGHLQAAASRKLGRPVHVCRVPADCLLGVGRFLA